MGSKYKLSRGVLWIHEAIKIRFNYLELIWCTSLGLFLRLLFILSLILLIICDGLLVCQLFLSGPSISQHFSKFLDKSLRILEVHNVDKFGNVAVITSLLRFTRIQDLFYFERNMVFRESLLLLSIMIFLDEL